MKAKLSSACMALILSSSMSAGCGGTEVPADADSTFDGNVPLRGFGETCSRTEDCESGLCLLVGDHSVCTRPCSIDGDCPSGDSWGCVLPEGLEGRVCGCAATDIEEICGNGLDDECNGAADDCRLCDGVPVPEDDPLHCGACGVRCRVGQECSDGACRCTAGTTACGTTCVDLLTSHEDCGSCGRACELNAACVGGACVCDSAAAPDYCPGLGCTNLETVAANCGTCGNRCPSGEVCRDGACACPSALETSCPTVGCVDTDSSRTNCGACGRACRSDEVCSGGACGCPAGQSLCGGVCRSFASDVDNCGSCGNVCAAGSACSGGRCVCDGGYGQVCDGVCYLANDRANCGACGRACRGDQFCNGGTPASCVCLDGTECGGRCANLLNEPTNCGACGVTCRAGEPCNGGRCECPYPTNTYCSGGCADLLNDTFNCGRCGNRCGPGQTCSSGGCYCPPSAPYLCDGACADLSSDENNCGSCGTVCPSGTTCNGWSCRCPGVNEQYCASATACVDIITSEAHCGTCDRACPADATCNFGSCACATPGETACGTDCTDLLSDEANCGFCGNRCVGSQVCTTGGCTCEAPVPSTPMRLSAAINNSFEVRLATHGTEVAVVWADARGGLAQIQFAILDVSGVVVVPASEISSAAEGAAHPDVVWTGSEWGVAWAENRSSPTASRVRLARFDGAGASLGASQVIDPIDASGSRNQVRELVLQHTSSLGFVLLHVWEAFASPGVFRVLGPTGATPQPPINIPVSAFSSAPASVDLAVGPSGELAALVSGSSTAFQRINADGSVTVAPTTGTRSYADVELAHDGVTWVAAWTESGSFGDAVVVARGLGLDARTTVVTGGLGAHPALIAGGGELVVAWRARASTSASTYRIDARRYTVPTSAVSPVAPLDAVARTYMADETVFPQSFTGVRTSATSLMLGWPDTRWGATEAYVLRVGLPACGI